ncbi:hypothetical protein QJQ45_030201 [Haematococcus lacustris]|nr:hypothetical protein QJQ45_030201 [Haematococcus lacustris]
MQPIGELPLMDNSHSDERQTAEITVNRCSIGRVIGKNGETIKALQMYTGALIQIDQSTEPTRVTVSGALQSLTLAINMISDISNGSFKGFALLRQMVQQPRPPIPTFSTFPHGTAQYSTQLRPMYAPGYGLIPPSQVRFGRMLLLSDEASVLHYIIIASLLCPAIFAVYNSAPTAGGSFAPQMAYGAPHDFTTGWAGTRSSDPLLLLRTALLIQCSRLQRLSMLNSAAMMARQPTASGMSLSRNMAVPTALAMAPGQVPNVAQFQLQQLQHNMRMQLPQPATNASLALAMQQPDPCSTPGASLTAQAQSKMASTVMDHGNLVQMRDLALRAPFDARAMAMGSNALNTLLGEDRDSSQERFRRVGAAGSSTTANSEGARGASAASQGAPAAPQVVQVVDGSGQVSYYFPA